MELLGNVGHVESHFGLFWNLVLVYLNIPQAQKSFWTHTMELPSDLGHVESHFNPFGDSGNLDARLVHSLRRTYHWLKNHFGRT
jgi:hypothetical protein